MDALGKLQALSDASQYDLSCACGTRQGSDHRTRGNDGTWLYPVSLPRGGTSIMLKTLMSNVCVNDCKFCPYRDTRDIPRCTIGPDELANLFMEYVRRKQVIGIFLSSGVVGTPDRSMALLTDTARILRERHDYRGYVHLKIIPGASDGAVDEALRLASGVSLNIETPGAGRFSQLSTKKDYLRDIIRPMRRISALTGKDGSAFIIIPGGLSKASWPVRARMRPPPDTDYELVGPEEIVLEYRQVSVDFLFTAP